MSAEKLIASHLRLAAEALAAADVLLRAGNHYAAYQAEQAVEQLVLALAQSEGVAFTRSQQHQLETMRRALPEDDPFREKLAPLTWLEAYATTFRYPRPTGRIAESPAPDRLRAAIEDTRILLSRVASYFEVGLDRSSQDWAAHARPPREP